ncbi:MAG: DUF2071 domain-containing protein [Opitutales bacterium]
MFWNRISQHPFPVEAHFDYSLVLTYAYPLETLEPLVPNCLELDTFQDRYAFIAVAMVQTRHLRPKGFPRWMGNNFFLAGYRIFVRYQSQAGRRLRGLYILRSETDKPKMRILGNLFTNYNYSTIRISADFVSGKSAQISSPTTGLNVTAALDSEDSVSLPRDSPFNDWREARGFAGPMPFTFSVNPKEVIIVEGKRSQWQPRPVRVLEANVPQLHDFVDAEPLLANAFITENIPYEWGSGRRETRH